MVVNFANADMVGHSGKIEPTVKAVETVDACLGDIYAAVKRSGGVMLVTADHGNAEEMIDPVTGGPFTAHTTNPVPFIYIGEAASEFTLRPDGALQDISPTVLGILGVPLAEGDDGAGFAGEEAVRSTTEIQRLRRRMLWSQLFSPPPSPMTHMGEICFGAPYLALLRPDVGGRKRAPLTI